MIEGLSSFFIPEYRLDWFDYGPGSPNRTAAFIAVYAVVVWWFALKFKCWGFWFSLALFSVCLLFLLQTESRGGFIAVLLGLVITFIAVRVSSAQSWREFALARSTWLRSSALLAVTIAGVWYAGELGMRDRLVSMASGRDESTSVRVQLYTAGLAMLRDASHGVGADQAGDFYAQWYQPVGDTRSYLSLVNSHLTWLVEYDLLFKVGYLLAWASVLALLWPSKGCGNLRIVTFAAWATIFATGLFSRTLNLPAAWIVPGLLLTGVLIERIVKRQALRKHELLLGVSSALGTIIILLLGTYLVPRSISVQATEELAIVGRPTEDPFWIIAPHQRVLGDKYGHSIREYLNELEQVRIDFGETWQHSNPKRMLFAGDAPLVDELPESAELIILMNPSSDSIEQWQRVAGDRPLKIYLGGMGDWRRARAWRNAAEDYDLWRVTTLPGVVDYIPDWPRYLLDQSDDVSDQNIESDSNSTLASGFDPFAM
ncbi:O-antigen ligase family protein [Cerasicoccus maritimus]|uniref:O-antigen ligase family protein n=1 Tax=Cerasicoccus maritimus TaxID=490089 RepID=UPI002852808A|nr:O-antigen ligase family protein [Cerasicoccus maritimus]